MLGREPVNFWCSVPKRKQLWTAGRIIGTTAVVVGLTLVVLIAYGLLTM